MALPTYTESEVATPGAEPWGIAFDGANIWSCDFNTGQLFVIDATTQLVVNAFAHTQCNSCVFDGTNIWATWDDGVNRFVAKYIALTQTFVASYMLPAGLTLGGLCSDGTNIWICNFNFASITKVLIATGAIVGTYSTNATTRPTACCFDGTNIWTANQFGDSLSKLLAATGAFIAKFPVGDQAQGIVFDGTNVWVSTQGKAPDFLPFVAKVDPGTGGVIASLNIGNGALGQAFLAGLAFDGTYIWVADGDGFGGDNLVAAVDPVTVTLAGSFNTLANGNPILLAVATVPAPEPNIWVSNNNFPFLSLLSVTAAPAGGAVFGTFVGFGSPGRIFGGTK